MMLWVVAEEAKLRAFAAILDEMVQQGLVALSEVDGIKHTPEIPGAEQRKEAQK
jgi:hypothetical protein